MPIGQIVSVEDRGSVWEIFYRLDEGGIDRMVFDWRRLAHFYEGTSGRNFYDDYNFGAGRETIKSHFEGRSLLVEGEEFDERVTLLD